MEPAWTITKAGKQGTLVVSKAFFQREAVFATLTAFETRCHIGVQPEGENAICITLISKEASELREEDISAFMNDLIDQQTRLDLEKAFGGLRDTIVRFAFTAPEQRHG